MKRNIVVIVVLVVVAILSFFVGRNTSSEQPQAQKGEVEKKVTMTFPGAEKHETLLLKQSSIFRTIERICERRKPRLRRC